MANSTEVAVKDEMTENLPDYLRGNDYTNDDNFDSSDIVIPRIKLLQGLSPEVETFDNAKSGIFWHTGLDAPLGDEIEFVVADRRKKILLSAPIADGQGVLARADDAKTWSNTGSWNVKLKGVKQPVTWEIKDLNVKKSGLMDWGSSNPDDEDSPPAATLFYDYLVYLPAHPEMGMAVISLARSQIKKAKRGLNDKIQMHGDNGRPMQALVFKAKVVDDHSDDGDFKNWAFHGAGFVQDKALFEHLMSYKGALANLRVEDETGDLKDPEAEDDGEGAF